MTLHYEDKMLINKTFHHILTNNIADTFYNHLFETSPELQPLFANTDMIKQRKMFMDMIRLIIYSIDNIEKVQKSIQEMGTRHVNYGVNFDDYPKVINAFLWTLQSRLGEDYTEDVDRAWRTTFDLIVSVASEDNYT